MNINILLDTPDSFFHEYVHDLINKLKEREHNVYFYKDHKKIKKGDILFIIACETILKKEQLSLNRKNVVIHPSKLPEDRGSSALIWKILEGHNIVYITLFEANEEIDKGDIYLQESIEFEGHELSNEIRNKQAMKIIDLILKYIVNYKNIVPLKQRGKSSFVRKRTFKDSELNVNKSIREQFNLLRVVDNKRYPAFFKLRGQRYTVKIYRDEKF